MQHQFVIGVSGYTPFPKIGRKRLPYAKRVLKDVPPQWVRQAPAKQSTWDISDLVVRCRDTYDAMIQITEALRMFTQHFNVTGNFRLSMDSRRGAAELRRHILASSTLMCQSSCDKSLLLADAYSMRLNGIGISFLQEIRPHPYGNVGPRMYNRKAAMSGVIQDESHRIKPVLPLQHPSDSIVTVEKSWGACLGPAAQKAALGPTSVEVAKMKEKLIAVEEEGERLHNKYREYKNAKRTPAQAQADAAADLHHLGRDR